MSYLKDVSMRSVFGAADGYQDTSITGNRKRHYKIYVSAVSGANHYQDLLANSSYRIISTTDCHFTFSRTADGYATVAHPFLPANVPEVYTTTTNRKRLSVIRDSADGYMYVTQLLDTDIE